VPLAVLGSARDCLSLFPSLLQAEPFYKTDQHPFSGCFSLFFLLATPSRRHTSSPEFPSTMPPRPNPHGPSLPHLLHWQPDLIRSSPRPCFAGIAPTPSHLSTGAARARPHHRQPLPLDLQLIQVLRSTPRSSLMLMRALLAHVHRSFAGNAGDPTRPPHLPVAGHVPLSPVEHLPAQTAP
jgi:hypothetical protein